MMDFATMKSSALLGLWVSALAVEAAAHVHAAREPAPSPEITPGPMIHELLRRQNDDDVPTTVLFGTDKTCGYLSGSAGAALTCDAGLTCNFIPDLLPTLTTSKIGVQMCCDAAECNGYLACVPSEVANDAKSCDDVCQGNSFTLKCSASDSPFCRTIIYQNTITNYDCVKFSPTGTASAAFTYDNYSGAFPFRTTTLPPVSGTASGGGNFLGLGTIASAEGSKSSSPAESKPAESTTPPDDGGDKKKSNTGAIVGGTIGGIAAVGLLGLGAMFILRRKKKDQTPPTPAPDMMPPQPMMQQGYPPPQQGYYPQMAPQSPSTVNDTIAYTASPAASPVPEEQKFQPFMQQNQMGMAPSTYDSRLSMMSGPDGSQYGGQQGVVMQPTPEHMYGHPQQQQQPHVPVEMGTSADHHRGNIHEMGS